MKPIDQSILDYISKQPLCSSKEIHERIGLEVGYATVKRSIKRLIDLNYVNAHGQAKGTRYLISPSYGITRAINLEEYFSKEIDERDIQSGFNFELIPEVLASVKLFTQAELDRLEALQGLYIEKVKTLSPVQYQKELERLAIDLSWKSSQIEGNTYSLLETERLLRDQETAQGKTPAEAIMLLNHKKALDFILEHTDYLNPVETGKIEYIHSILIKDLMIQRNIRSRSVGISGTNYRPLDNEHQVREALAEMCVLVNSKDNVFEKALLLLVLLSYIQAFEDGNKRTARIVSNACLIDNGYCPISFRTIDSVEYKKAMLLFYEQNNISAFKTVFMDQFEFAVNTYF